MKSGFAVAAAVGLAAVTLALSPAKAQVLGQVSITGTDTTVDLPPTTVISFTSNGTVQTVSGNLTAAFPVGTQVGMIGAGAALNFNNPAVWVGQKLFGSTPEDLTITSFNSQVVGGTSLDLSGTGIFSGVVATPATWTLTSQIAPGGISTNTTFSAQAVSVPGPIVGAGLPGLIAGLGGLVALARRRRNQLALA